MPVTEEDVMRLLGSISNKRGIVWVHKGFWRGIVLSGLGFGIGGLLGGPPGLAIGTIVGSMLGAEMVKEQRKPVSQVLDGLSTAQRQKLFSKVKDIICNLDSMDDKQLTQWVMSSETLQQQLVDMLQDFFNNKLIIPSKEQK